MSQDPSTEFWRSHRKSCKSRIQECELCSTQTQVRSELREGATVHPWPKNLKSHMRGWIGLGVVVIINTNRPNFRTTVRDRLFTCSMEQVQMASMRAFQELQIMKRTRQYVFAHIERRGQRGYADLTPEVELDKGKNLPAEVVPPEGEPTSAKPDESHRRSRQQMRYKATSSEWVASSAAPRREEFPPVSHYVYMWHSGEHWPTTPRRKRQFSLSCVNQSRCGC